MKILIAGDWHSELHEQPLYEALKNIGHDVYKFSCTNAGILLGAGPVGIYGAPCECFGYVFNFVINMLSYNFKK